MGWKEQSQKKKKREKTIWKMAEIIWKTEEKNEQTEM